MDMMPKKMKKPKKKKASPGMTKPVGLMPDDKPPKKMKLKYGN
jgi:hypothetical protein